MIETMTTILSALDGHAWPTKKTDNDFAHALKKQLAQKEVIWIRLTSRFAYFEGFHSIHPFSLRRESGLRHVRMGSAQRLYYAGG